MEGPGWGKMRGRDGQRRLDTVRRYLDQGDAEQPGKSGKLLGTQGVRSARDALVNRSYAARTPSHSSRQSQ